MAEELKAEVEVAEVAAAAVAGTLVVNLFLKYLLEMQAYLMDPGGR